MKSIFKNPSTYLLFFLSGCFSMALGQTNSIPTWQFTPSKVITSNPVQYNDNTDRNQVKPTQFVSSESYTSDSKKVENQNYYPFSDKHYKFLKVVPEGAPTNAYTPNTLYQVGQTLPNVQLPNKNGLPVNLSDTRGKYTLVHFWASWCPTSMLKVPHYQDLYEKYGQTSFADANGFEIFAISLDKEREDWLEVIDEEGLTWAFNTTDAGAVEAYSVDIIPASYLLDPNGVIIGKDMCESKLDYTLSQRTQLAKNNALAANTHPQNRQPNVPFSNSARLASNVETYHATSMTANYRVELGIFSTLAFHDFSHFQHLGRIYKEPTAMGGTRVLVGDFTDKGSATNAAKELINKGYYNAHIISYRFLNQNNNEEIAEQPTPKYQATNLFRP